MRAKIVLLASQGLGNDRIAARLSMPRQIVSKWLQRFYYERLPGLDEQPRGGRPARFSPGVVVAIKALACELPSRRGLPLARWSVAELTGSSGERCCGKNQWHDALALAWPGRIASVAPS